jgi:2-iminobutanoate/2-iminopropanoate deaminase
VYIIAYGSPEEPQRRLALSTILDAFRRCFQSAFPTGNRGLILGKTMEFLFTSLTFPYSKAAVHSGRTLETVLTPIPDGQSTPVGGGATAELREIFRQLDEVLAAAGVGKTSIVSVRLYLQEVGRDIAAVNEVYREYFGAHPPSRRAYGVALQAGMLIEAAFVAELP